jgi:diadenylate cyclase
MDEILRAISKYIQHVGTYSPIVVIVELVLIGAVVWWTTIFLRGTRGARLVKGMALLMSGLYIIISLLPRNVGDVDLGWDRLQFLYGKFLFFAFVAAMVAFQPEIRRALIQLGQTGLFRGRQEQVEPLVDAMVESAGYLSRNKIGALVAVERSVGLVAIMETGTPIDATVTAGLLDTIFYPGSALHDMGVVISNRRLAAAGCQFPLAESDDVDPSLGSRHRAALGLAQESDAVVLVVSEETGRTSIACDGQLYLGLDIDDLREMLFALLATKKATRKRRQARQAEAAENK